MRQSSSKLTLSRKKGSCLSWLIVTVKQDHLKNFNCWRFYITACFWHTFSGMKSVRTTENLLTISFLLSRAAFCSRYNWSDKELGVKSLQVYISCPRWTNEWFSAAAVQTSNFFRDPSEQTGQVPVRYHQTGQHHLYPWERGGTNNPGKH